MESVQRTTRRLNFFQSAAADLCCCAKTGGKDVDDLRADIGVELASHLFGSAGIGICDRCHKGLGNAKGLPKTPCKLMFRIGGRTHALLRNSQLVRQHSAIGFLETTVVTCGSDCAMKIEIGENDCF